MPPQLACLLVGDEVPLRFHWPKHVDLRVNNLPHRPYGRATNAKMGVNQRDDVAAIGARLAAAWQICVGPPHHCVQACHCSSLVLLLQHVSNTGVEASSSNSLTPAVPAGNLVVRGRNSLGISAADGGTWVLMLQLARRRTLEQASRRAPSEMLLWLLMPLWSLTLELPKCKPARQCVFLQLPPCCWGC
jgi:hypothetical protein